jgi:hypothetical protein
MRKLSPTYNVREFGAEDPVHKRLDADAGDFSGLLMVAAVGDDADRHSVFLEPPQGRCRIRKRYPGGFVALDVDPEQFVQT